MKKLFMGILLLLLAGCSAGTKQENSLSEADYTPVQVVYAETPPHVSEEVYADSLVNPHNEITIGGVLVFGFQGEYGEDYAYFIVDAPHREQLAFLCNRCDGLIALYNIEYAMAFFGLSSHETTQYFRVTGVYATLVDVVPTNERGILWVATISAIISYEEINSAHGTIYNNHILMLDAQHQTMESRAMYVGDEFNGLRLEAIHRSEAWYYRGWRSMDMIVDADFSGEFTAGGNLCIQVSANGHSSIMFVACENEIYRPPMLYNWGADSYFIRNFEDVLGALDISVPETGELRIVVYNVLATFGQFEIRTWRDFTSYTLTLTELISHGDITSNHYESVSIDYIYIRGPGSGQRQALHVGDEYHGLTLEKVHGMRLELRNGEFRRAYYGHAYFSGERIFNGELFLQTNLRSFWTFYGVQSLDFRPMPYFASTTTTGLRLLVMRDGTMEELDQLLEMLEFTRDDLSPDRNERLLEIRVDDVTLVLNGFTNRWNSFLYSFDNIVSIKR